MLLAADLIGNVLLYSLFRKNEIDIGTSQHNDSEADSADRIGKMETETSVKECEMES